MEKWKCIDILKYIENCKKDIPDLMIRGFGLNLGIIRCVFMTGQSFQTD